MFFVVSAICRLLLLASYACQYASHMLIVHRQTGIREADYAIAVRCPARDKSP